MKRILLGLVICFFSATAGAVDNMTIFLKSCAYGTAVGAIVGLATLATSENPSGKINNVARGASLGLYAGVGFGLYTIYGKKESSEADSFTQNPVWFSTIAQGQKIDGFQLNWAWFSF